MDFPLPAVLVGVGFIASALLGLRYVGRSLRARGQAEIDKRFPAGEVLRADTLAQSYGQQSRGSSQVRGNGALALTAHELWFLQYVPESELRVPLASITDVSIVPSHLGRASRVGLLRVAFSGVAGDDAIAWRVRDPEAWKAQLEGLRA